MIRLVVAAAIACSACTHADTVRVDSWRPAERAGVVSVALVERAGTPSSAQTAAFTHAAEAKCAGPVVVDEEGAHPGGVVVDEGHYAWVFHCDGAKVAREPAGSPAGDHAADLDAGAHAPDLVALDTREPVPEAMALFRSAHAKFIEGDCASSMPDLEKAAQLDPLFAEPMRDIALCQKKAGDQARACNAAREFIARKRLTGANADATAKFYCPDAP